MVQVMPQGNAINHTSFVLENSSSGGSSHTAIVVSLLILRLAVLIHLMGVMLLSLF